MEEKKEIRSLAVTLTQEELLSLSKELANATQELRNSDNRKKETV